MGDEHVGDVDDVGGQTPSAVGAFRYAKAATTATMIALTTARPIADGGAHGPCRADAPPTPLQQCPSTTTSPSMSDGRPHGGRWRPPDRRRRPHHRRDGRGDSRRRRAVSPAQGRGGAGRGRGGGQLGDADAVGVRAASVVMGMAAAAAQVGGGRTARVAPAVVAPAAAFEQGGGGACEYRAPPQRERPRGGETAVAGGA